MANALAEEIRLASRRFKAHGRKQSDADELCEVALLDLAILVEASGAETSDEFEERRYGCRELANVNGTLTISAKGA